MAASVRQFTRRVRRSLLQRELIFAIPQAGMLVILFLAVIFMYVLRLYAAAVPLILLYLVMRSLTAKDPFFIDIVLENIQQKDVYLP